MVARLVARRRPADGRLVVAASMPMRDLEWFGGAGAVAHANRGANGIDGVVATALGTALSSGAPTVALVGDIAFVHDSGALTGLAARDADLRIVVVDNDGGGIFSFLPQATELPPDALRAAVRDPARHRCGRPRRRPRHRRRHRDDRRRAHRPPRPPGAVGDPGADRSGRERAGPRGPQRGGGRRPGRRRPGARGGSAPTASPGTWPASRPARPARRCRRRCRRRRAGGPADRPDRARRSAA